jgi:unsaturated rhamnogalacturonyl hydrolase
MKSFRSSLVLQFTSVCLMILFLLLQMSCTENPSDKAARTDKNSLALHQLPPAYPVPYGIPKTDSITKVLVRVLNYLNSTTPMAVVNKIDDRKITDFSVPDSNAILQRGDFPIISYEWGVTYGAMLRAGEVTGNADFTAYVREHLSFIAAMDSVYKKVENAFPGTQTPLEKILHPGSLDDAGSMCAAMIKATRAGVNYNLRPMIDNYIDYISNHQFRLDDHSFARKGPYPHTLWLDDLYMSVPALAQMGKLSGDTKYYDDAVRQILQFSSRMFDKEKGLFMHGWAVEMEVHPEFCWGRANGWAIMAMIELLDVLPENCKGRDEILHILQSHMRGIAQYQSGTGLWHQLIDRNDTYLETSASAIFVYCMARAINLGYIDAKVYGPQVLLGWNGLSTRVDSVGQVEGTCVGTGMGFDPAFYYYRPQSPLAAHGYGPILLAGAEVIEVIKSHKMAVEGGSVKFYVKN